MLTNATDALAQFASNYREAMDWFLCKVVEQFGAAVVFEGGDNALLSVDGGRCSIDGLEGLRSDFARRIGRTLSIGIGHSAHQAYLALKLAKTSGKDRIWRFEELTYG